MAKNLIILLFLFSIRSVFGQTFLDSYRTYCINKINSSVQQRTLISSSLNDKSVEKIDALQKQLTERLNYQIKKLSAIFNQSYKSTGVKFNKKDSLTIIYQTNSSSGLADYLIISGKDTLESNLRLALCREVNNGGGRLEPLKKGSASFKVYKRSNRNITNPFLELTSKADTGYAYSSVIYCPAEIGTSSIIITAKKKNRRYEISDYYLHEFNFVAIPREK